MTQFKFDQKGLERAVQQAAKQGLQQKANAANREMAQFSRLNRGKSAASIKPGLKRLWEKHFGRISDRDLTDYAQRISEGDEIKFRS